MMGSKQRQFAPLIHVSLEELVPADHFYRRLERTLDLSFVREFVQHTYAGGGRPSIDPMVFFKLQLVMFFEGIRSERQLMRHAADRLSVRWYLGYDLNEPLPDHSSLTRIRERYGVDVFRRFFEAIVEQCQQEKLVWGKELYIDSTQVNANADLDSLTPRFAVEARAAIQAHLATLFAEQEASRSRKQQRRDRCCSARRALAPEVYLQRASPPARRSLPSRARGTSERECSAARLDRRGRSATTGGTWPLPADVGLQSQHHRSGCHADAAERGRHAFGLSYPLRRRWRQSAR